MSETLIFSENNKLPPTKKIFIGQWLLKIKKNSKIIKVFNNNLSIKIKLKSINT